jgi:hypothetical protein
MMLAALLLRATHHRRGIFIANRRHHISYSPAALSHILRVPQTPITQQQPI